MSCDVHRNRLGRVPTIQNYPRKAVLDLLRNERKPAKMRHEKRNAKTHSDEDFRRMTGVKRGAFAKMTEILAAARVEKRKKRGRKPKLSPEEMPLAMIEYRTYVRIAASYGLDESNMYRAIKWVEDTLVKDGAFSLPGKKALLRDGMGCEVILVDATETPVERPKKTAQALFGQEKAALRENAGSGEEIRRADSCDRQDLICQAA